MLGEQERSHLQKLFDELLRKNAGLLYLIRMATERMASVWLDEVRHRLGEECG
jgi:hypothetical protein